MRRGEIWWASIDGIRRPVVILTRDRVLPLLTRVTVAPITRTSRGVASEVPLDPAIDGVREPSVASLDNVFTIRKDELSDRQGQVSSPAMELICHALTYALGC